MCHTHCGTGLSVYNGHIRGPVTLTIVAGRLAVELSLPVFSNQVCRDRGSKIRPPVCDSNATAEVIKKPYKTFEIMSRGIYSMSPNFFFFFWKQNCHRNYHFGAGFFFNQLLL